ncbi:MAG: hypothetical protein JXR82_14455 [Marinifilaceae bacterium]|nr:hypothetical protein [Marinifilaceae bacterium]
MNKYEKFIEFEKNNSLFSFKTKDDIPIWQLLRYDIYNLVLERKNIDRKVNIYIKVWSFILAILSQVKFLFYRIDYLYFGASRVINGACVELPYQKMMLALDDDLSCVYVETNFSSFPSYDKSARSLVPLLKLISHYFCYIKKDDKLLLNEIFKSIKLNYPNLELSEMYLYQILFLYKLEYKYYNILFKLKKIKKVFFTKNGMAYSLIGAARHNSITTYEFQHGDIVFSDVSISYENIDSKNLLIPDFHLTYSNFWTKNITTHSKCIEVGFNANYNVSCDMDLNEKGFLLIVDLFDTDRYIDLAIKLSERYADTLIYFKLHPRQVNERNRFQNLFSVYKNIIVIGTEFTVLQLCSKIDRVLGSYSTALYEAYDEGCSLFLYKAVGDREYVFPTTDNIVFYRSIEELYRSIDSCQNARLDRVRTFFKTFDIDKFKQIISS